MAVLVGQDLELDMARPHQVLLHEDLVAGEGLLRLALGHLQERLEFLVLMTTRMPLPPPPAAALMSTG